MKKKKYHQGDYIPVNPKKYIISEQSYTKGKGIRYMSSWEKKFFQWCDMNTSVVRWVSEGFPIPYIKPTDNRQHRYYPDVYIEVLVDGIIVKYVIEIKPKKERYPPKKPRRGSNKALERYAKEMVTYQVNQSKWKYAEAFCKQKGFIFKVMDETDLGV